MACERAWLQRRSIMQPQHPFQLNLQRRYQRGVSSSSLRCPSSTSSQGQTVAAPFAASAFPDPAGAVKLQPRRNSKHPFQILRRPPFRRLRPPEPLSAPLLVIAPSLRREPRPIFYFRDGTESSLSVHRNNKSSLRDLPVSE